MTQRPALSPVQSTDALRLRMERAIDELAEMARRSGGPAGIVESGQFFAEALRRALVPGGASHATLWRKSLEGNWELAGTVPDSAPLEGAELAARQELLIDVANHSQPRVVGGSLESNGHPASELQLYSPLRHAGQTVGILETRHVVQSGEGLSSTTCQFFAAIGEITADFLSQQELQQLRQASLSWHQWDQLLRQLAASSQLTDVCSVIANDGRHLLGCDRISILIKRGGYFRLQSVSGVERVNLRAGSVRSLELLAGEVANLGQPVWCILDSLETPNASQSESQPANERLQESLVRHAQESGTSCLGAIPIVFDDKDSADTRTLAIITFEQFHSSADWPSKKPLAEALYFRSLPSLRSAIELDAVPWRSFSRRILRSPHPLMRPKALLSMAVMIAVILAMTLIPAEFTVTGRGELWPDHRRDVFAATSGIVDQILVEHGSEVQRDQPLIVLRDPQLEQDLPKVLGEIGTTNERLRGIQTVRLTGSGSAGGADSASRFRQLTADEEELKERLKALELQRKLLEERKGALTLRSPIAGRVLTWDVEQHLAARPVDRGQALLTIGKTAGAWILEIRVADKDAGPILRAKKSGKQDLPVDFLLAAEPGRVYHGKLRDVSLSTESDELSTGYVRVIVEFDRDQIEQLRPGATAIPRIRCGHRPIGYVWLHDLIDAVRTRVLF